MRHMTAFLIITFLVLASASWGIEAQLKNGQTMQADQMTFDGQTVTLYKDGSKYMFKASEIKFLKSDTEGQKAAQQKANTLQKQIDKMREDLKTLEDDLLKAEQDLIKERTRYGQLLEKNRKMEKTLSNTDIDALQKDLEKLRADNRRLTQSLSKMQDELSLAKASADEAPEIPVDKMKTSEAKFEKSATKGLVSVMGRVTNTADKAVGAVVIEVTALDQNGSPLASRLTHVLNVEPNTHATWRTDLEADFDKISQLQTRVADVLITLPQ